MAGRRRCHVGDVARVGVCDEAHVPSDGVRCRKGAPVGVTLALVGALGAAIARAGTRGRCRRGATAWVLRGPLLAF